MSIELVDLGAPAAPATPLPPRLLAAIAAGWAATADVDAVPGPAAGLRTYCRLLDTDEYDVWLIRWGAGSSAPLHDHAGSAGALHVVEGTLSEERSDPGWPDEPSTIGRDRGKVFGVGHVHEVRNDAPGPAASIHVYSPPLRAMTYYTRSTGPVPLPLYRTVVTPVSP
jgi:mannose-6-phosphate isomerase-like protein (cupin superfamily)